jgi:tetratricopeptide (TPR) repeat protein
MGWLELSAPEEAWKELEEIAPEDRHRMEVVVMRLQILQSLKRWEDEALVGRGALTHYPDCGALYLITAYCVRRHESLEAAKALLSEGGNVLSNEALWHFNLACYECQLGNLDTARARLDEAFRIDPKMRKQALEDGDLEPLWAGL